MMFTSLSIQIHDKKLGPIIFDLLSTMCEKIGPYPVIECVQNGMESSKIPMQQKAVLQWMETLIKDFGANSLDVKQILTYLQKPQGFQSSNPAVKSAATSLLLELYRQVSQKHSVDLQLGPVITSVLDQFDLSDLQKKSIRSVLESVQYEPSSTTQESAPSSEPGTAISQSILSIRDPSDISTEVDLSMDYQLVDSTFTRFTSYRREGQLEDSSRSYSPTHNTPYKETAYYRLYKRF